MAHDRAERRRKTALIKRKLEREVQKELAFDRRWDRSLPLEYSHIRACYGASEHAVRRRRFKNEGRRGRNCWECHPRACSWCLEGFYRKHLRRARALEHDLQEYLNGDYDALRAEGAVIPNALLVKLPRPMRMCAFNEG